jgi:hypothetical protein
LQQETKSQKRKQWTPVWVACLLLVGIAAWTSTLIPMKNNPEQKAQSEKSPLPYLGIWEGNLARFDGENTVPEEVYEVRVSSLPKEEQNRLKNGITWESEEAFAELIEAYTG